MHVKLKVTRGSPKVVRGANATRARRGDMQRYLVGSGDHCHLCCTSSSVSPQHCMFVIDGTTVAVQDMGSQSGTFVNGERIERACLLQLGDRVRVGELEFQTIIEGDPRRSGEGTAARETEALAEDLPSPAAPDAKDHDDGDDGDDGISDWLIDADEAERASRRANPETRKLKLDDTRNDDSRVAGSSKAEKPAKPVKQPPLKLPPRPKYRGTDSVGAADEMLKKMFGIYYRPPTK